MNFINTLLFILLGAVWGSAFIFMRVITPYFGAVGTAVSRMLIGGTALLLFFRALKVDMRWRKNLRHYAIVGILNSAVPFLLFAFAIMRLPAVIPAVVNSLSPLAGAVLSFLILKENLTIRKILGLLFGVAGVALIAFRGVGLSGKPDALALLACIFTPISYGFAAVYMKRWASDVPPRPMTAASLTLGGLGLAPFLLLSPPTAIQIPLAIWAAAIVFGLLCTAFGFYLYYYLISTSGVTPTLSVSLLIPLFAFFWSYLFLGETVTLPVAAGCCIVLTGTALVIFGAKKATRPPSPSRSASS
ncbi:MAG: DMT family transporter [Treponemataceae bacterium]